MLFRSTISYKAENEFSFLPVFLWPSEDESSSGNREYVTSEVVYSSVCLKAALDSFLTAEVCTRIRAFGSNLASSLTKSRQRSPKGFDEPWITVFGEDYQQIGIQNR